MWITLQNVDNFLKSGNLRFSFDENRIFQLYRNPFIQCTLRTNLDHYVIGQIFMSFKKSTFFFAIVFLSLSVNQLRAQQLKVIKFSDLQQIMEAQDDKLKVINFWATWCGPCVKELPQFESLQAKYKERGLEMILISFDFVEQIGKANKFAADRNLKSTLYLLDETDYNSFIDKVHPSWSGAIPATLMIDSRNGKKAFFEKEFHEGELEKTYLDFVN